jgi:hypothetical protein
MSGTCAQIEIFNLDDCIDDLPFLLAASSIAASLRQAERTDAICLRPLLGAVSWFGGGRFGGAGSAAWVCWSRLSRRGLVVPVQRRRVRLGAGWLLGFG